MSLDEVHLRWSDVLDRCAAVLDEQGLLQAGPFDLDDFTARLAAARGRAIHLTPIRLPADAATVCGVCISTSRADHVYYAHTLSSLHATHNAVHELCHLVLDHRSVAPLARPSLGSSWVRSSESTATWLGGVQMSYAEHAEYEADAAASILLSRSQDRAPKRWASRSIMRVGVARLSDAFG